VTLPRIPEPISDPQTEADLYREMDHRAINDQFVSDLIDGGPVGPQVVDLGCGPADIPIKLVARLRKLHGSQVPSPQIQVMAIDSQVEMLEIARAEIDFAGMIDHFILEHADGSHLIGFPSEMTDTVISNSFIHHLDDPSSGMAEAVRLLKTNGRLFVRDLFRPETDQQIESLVQRHADQESDDAKQLLRQSLHAALTLEEITNIAKDLGIPSDCVCVTSDRHWTIDWTK
jgi:ubiquinone/menaquinone biosynthesis C-methylase UbiE